MWSSNSLNGLNALANAVVVFVALVFILIMAVVVVAAAVVVGAIAAINLDDISSVLAT